MLQNFQENACHVLRTLKHTEEVRTLQRVCASQAFKSCRQDAARALWACTLLLLEAAVFTAHCAPAQSLPAPQASNNVCAFLARIAKTANANPVLHTRFSPCSAVLAGRAQKMPQLPVALNPPLLASVPEDTARFRTESASSAQKQHTKTLSETTLACHVLTAPRPQAHLHLPLRVRARGATRQRVAAALYARQTPTRIREHVFPVQQTASLSLAPQAFSNATATLALAVQLVAPAPSVHMDTTGQLTTPPKPVPAVQTS